MYVYVVNMLLLLNLLFPPVIRPALHPARCVLAQVRSRYCWLPSKHADMGTCNLLSRETGHIDRLHVFFYLSEPMYVGKVDRIVEIMTR